MRKNLIQNLLLLLAVSCPGLNPVQAQTKSPSATIPAKMVVTVRALDDNQRALDVNREDVVVKQGKHRLQVARWTPMAAERSELFILIDNAADTGLGLQLGDLRDFINSLPAATAVGVGYMQNGTVQIARDFTTNRSQTANALRLPLASSSAFANPYLSVIDLMNRWPSGAKSREVIMITDGIDRFRGGPRYRRLDFSSPDVDSASRVAQRTGTIIHTIFTRGVGQRGSNFWEITNGQNSMARLSDETGGESFFLGTQNALSFKPYFERLQKTFANRYLLEFNAVPGSKSGLQPVKLTTELAGIELNSADNVWVDSR